MNPCSFSSFRAGAASNSRLFSQNCSLSLMIPMSQSAYCKFLFSREQFLFCYIAVPDLPDRLPAIGHDGKYYRLFRTVESAKQGLQLATKPNQNGNEVAITQAGRNYIIWTQEDSAVVYQMDQQSNISAGVENHSETLKATFSASSCLILSNVSAENFCLLTVSNSVAPVMGFQHQQLYYRLIQREHDAGIVVNSIAERACRGGKIAVIPMKNDYGIFVSDPLAIPTIQRNS